MRIRRICAWARVTLAAGLFATTAPAATELFSAKLIGDNEVPPNNTAGAATFRMEVGSTITFSITFSGLSTNLLLAHLHFAPTKVAGGVMIFLCGGGNQPACPAGTSGNRSMRASTSTTDSPERWLPCHYPSQHCEEFVEFCSATNRLWGMPWMR